MENHTFNFKFWSNPLQNVYIVYECVLKDGLILIWEPEINLEFPKINGQIFQYIIAHGIA